MSLIRIIENVIGSFIGFSLVVGILFIQSEIADALGKRRKRNKVV
jgi:hypothetical protein